MIYIISEINDINTNYIIEWITSKEQKFIRLNTGYFTELSYRLSSKKTEIKVLDNQIKSEDVFFHRRGKLNVVTPRKLKDKSIYSFVKSEADSIVKSLEIFLKEESRYIGSFLKENQNFKITHLQHAQKAGFKIPNTIVTTQKKELQSFYNENEKIITKVLRFPLNLKPENKHYFSSKTFIVEQKHINQLDNLFSPIFCQEYIDKKYEIRLFIFNNFFYPMAIFSQNNEKTKIDYRNYDMEKPNRYVPVLLPKHIKNQVDIFLKLSNLDSGSIDLIVTQQNEYYFLEINPQGQFDWVSKNCNYYIERDIANYLILIEEYGKNQ